MCSPRWGRAFDAALLGAGRALLRKQTAVGGGYLSHVTATRQTVAGPSAVTPDWVARLQLVVEPRLLPAKHDRVLVRDSDLIRFCFIDDGIAQRFQGLDRSCGHSQRRGQKPLPLQALLLHCPCVPVHLNALSHIPSIHSTHDYDDVGSRQ